MVFRQSKKQHKEDQLLEELGFGQSDICSEERITNGINVIPVKFPTELPEESYVIDAHDDEEATKYFLRFEPHPIEIYRMRNMYFMFAPELPDMFKETVKQ